MERETGRSVARGLSTFKLSGEVIVMMCVEREREFEQPNRVFGKSIVDDRGQIYKKMLNKLNAKNVFLCISSCQNGKYNAVAD